MVKKILGCVAAYFLKMFSCASNQKSEDVSDTEITNKSEVEQYFEIILMDVADTGKTVSDFFKEKLNCFDVSEVHLRTESRLFVFWIYSICFSKENIEMMDLLISKTCEMANFNQKDERDFIKNINLRFQKYNEAFDIFENNPKRIDMVGSAMVAIIKKQNPNYSSLLEIPLDMDDVLKASVLFGEIYKATTNIVSGTIFVSTSLSVIKALQNTNS